MVDTSDGEGFQTANYSLHRFYHPRFGQILRDHFVESNELQLEQIVAINQDLPMKIMSELKIEG